MSAWDSGTTRRQFMRGSGLFAVGAMSAPTLAIGVGGLRQFIDKFYEAWRRADTDPVLAYFADDAVVNLYDTSTAAAQPLLASP